MMDSDKSWNKLEKTSATPSSEECTKGARKRISRFFQCLPCREKCSNKDSCQEDSTLLDERDQVNEHFLPKEEDALPGNYDDVQPEPEDQRLRNGATNVRGQSVFLGSSNITIHYHRHALNTIDSEEDDKASSYASGRESPVLPAGSTVAQENNPSIQQFTAHNSRQLSSSTSLLTAGQYGTRAAFPQPDVNLVTQLTTNPEEQHNTVSVIKLAHSGAHSPSDPTSRQSASPNPQSTSNSVPQLVTGAASQLTTGLSPQTTAALSTSSHEAQASAIDLDPPSDLTLRQSASPTPQQLNSHSHQPTTSLLPQTTTGSSLRTTTLPAPNPNNLDTEPATTSTRQTSGHNPVPTNNPVTRQPNYPDRAPHGGPTNQQIPSTQQISIMNDTQPNNPDSELVMDPNNQQPTSPESGIQQTGGSAAGTGGLMIQVGDDIWLYYSKQLRLNYDVYEGVQKPETGKKKHPVAVKIYHIAGNSDDWITRYCQEVDNMRSLTAHQHVAEYIHSARVKTNESWNKIYIAIRLYHKMTLADILPYLMKLKSKARHRIATGIFRQICHGVKHLHNNDPQIAHMDLKPTNILFSTDGKRAIVSDFSISREVDIKRTGEANQRTITKSNSSYGGTQGWKPAEMLQSENNAGKPNFLKADNFSLGLVGCHIFCNEHPFSDSENPTVPACWHVNIMRKTSPKFDDLEVTHEGNFSAALFKNMLSHKPDDRSSIEKVLGHFLFWDASKRLRFIRHMNILFENLKKKKDGNWMNSEELVLAFFPVPMVRTAADSETVQNGSQTGSTMETPANPGQGENSSRSSDESSGSDTPSENSSSRSFDTSSGLDTDLRPEFVLPDVDDIFSTNTRSLSPESQSTVVFTEHSNTDNSAEPYCLAENKNKPKSDALKKAFDGIPDSKKKIIFDDFRDVISESFLEKIKNTKTSWYNESDEHNYRKNSLSNLVRLIRNYNEHRLDPDAKDTETWEFWYSLFPKLLPLLYRITEDIFSEEYKNRYKAALAAAGEIDVKDLLEKAKQKKVEGSVQAPEWHS